MDDVLPLSKPLTGRNGQLISSLPIPAGTRVECSISNFNLSEDVWGADALTFRPSRFLDLGDHSKPVIDGRMTINGSMDGLLVIIRIVIMCKY